MKSTKRKIKRFFKRNSVLFIFVLIVVPFLFIMGTGYSLSKISLQLNGDSEITYEEYNDPEDASHRCKMGVSYVIENQWGGNGSSIKGYAKFSLENQSDGDILMFIMKIPNANTFTVLDHAYYSSSVKNSSSYLASISWAGDIKKGQTGTFQVAYEAVDGTDVNSILDRAIITNCGGTAIQGGKTLTSGNATLTLADLEFELDASIEYVSTDVNDPTLKTYKLTIKNNSEYQTATWRGVIDYSGAELHTMSQCVFEDNPDQKLVSISDRSSSVSFGNGYIDPGNTVTIDLMIKNADDNWQPKFVFAGLVHIYGETNSTAYSL